MDEEWRDVPGYEGWYQVSNLGRVRSVDRLALETRFGCAIPPRTRRLKGCILKPGTGHKGHLQVVLQRDGKKTGKTVGVLVAEAFLGPRPHPSFDCCHNDGNPTHNAVVNLRWGSRASNHADAKAHGTARAGILKRARLSPEAVRRIRDLHGKHTRPQLAAMFGVSVHHVWMIHAGRAWRDA